MVNRKRSWTGLPGNVPETVAVTIDCASGRSIAVGWTVTRYLRLVSSIQSRMAEWPTMSRPSS